MSPRPRSIPPSEAADVLARVAPLVTRWVERLLAGNDPPLTLAQYLVLLDVAGGSGSSSELARRAGVSSAAISQLLLALEDAGYVQRARRVDDRRRHDLSLTRAGGEALASARALVGAGLGTLLSDIPKPELDSLARLLRRLDEPFGGTAPPRRRPRPPGTRRGPRTR